MIVQVLLTCSFTTLLVHGQRFSKSIEAQPRIGYSSTVVHTYPENKDLHSESSVKVNFQPHQGGALNNNQNRGALKYLQTSNNDPRNSFYTRAIFDEAPSEINSFNVGYNISFSEPDSTKIRKQVYTRAQNKRLEDAEVITGKSKKNEKVRAPSVSADMSPQDYVAQAFLKQKQLSGEKLRHTSSPINTQGITNSMKYLHPIQEYVSKYPSQSPKFTYNTQQNIFKDVIKATKPDPVQLRPEFKSSYQTSSLWNNVSPGLEISKSIEPQVVDRTYENTYKYTNSKSARNEQPKNFNHDRALKDSQSFDFSNAHGEILYDERDNVPDGSEKNYEVYEHTNRKNIENNSPFSDLNNVNIEAHIPAHLRGVKPLPLDTSLLKDAVLTTDIREPTKDSRVIPIHFDISNIQKAMQEQLSQIQNYASQHVSEDTRLDYDNHEALGNENDHRMYEKPDPVETNHYRTGFNNYDRQRVNFDSDIYKIVSMRPPPIGPNDNY